MLTPQQSSDDWRTLTLARSRTRIVRAAANGHDYRISLSLPDEPPPEAGYPVLIVLDGVSLFPTVAETERRLTRRPQVTGVLPTVIIGVGHAGGGLTDDDQRHRDFTPGPSTDDGAAARRETGGADLFLDFLIEEAIPLAAAQARIDRDRLALMGHSLAGYFVLHALATRPDAFAAYGAVSPAIWWDPQRLARAAETLDTASVRLLLAVGQREQVDPKADLRRGARRMVEAVQDLGARMTSKLGADRVEVSVLQDEDHASVVAPAAVRMLRLTGRL